jgi:hypothetical protein
MAEIQTMWRDLFQEDQSSVETQNLASLPFPLAPAAEFALEYFGDLY